jgi:hypothetical protein
MEMAIRKYREITDYYFEMLIRINGIIKCDWEECRNVLEEYLRCTGEGKVRFERTLAFSRQRPI